MKLLIEFTDATQSLMRSIVRFNETLTKKTTDQKLINNSIFFLFGVTFWTHSDGNQWIPFAQSPLVPTGMARPPL